MSARAKAARRSWRRAWFAQWSVPRGPLHDRPWTREHHERIERLMAGLSDFFRGCYGPALTSVAYDAWPVVKVRT